MRRIREERRDKKLKEQVTIQVIQVLQQQHTLKKTEQVLNIEDKVTTLSDQAKAKQLPIHENW